MGNLIPNPERFGLDFALPAMFIGLLFMQLNNKKEILVAVFSALISLGFASLLKGNWNIIIAAAAGATIGMVIEGWKAKSSLSLSE